jgi:hypothetical protein
MNTQGLQFRNQKANFTWLSHSKIKQIQTQIQLLYKHDAKKACTKSIYHKLKKHNVQKLPKTQ